MGNIKYHLDDEVRRVASAIWEIRREIDDKQDLSIDDLSENHSLWDEARAAIRAIGLSDRQARVCIAPHVAMLEAGWDALDDDGLADFINPEDLAAAWYAMLKWNKENPDAIDWG